ncbi:uncharacterized protein ARMOST_10444 [Armillaria ostoyae]|uniref:Uncharacterized protein n=1 Tax=Armillaria ostoyae TaxID=47428 RepID=A0A284REA8_ARMOS|nr:uncharacterized protein ARMOST_10444 [Armillaria ostoyae]
MTPDLMNTQTIALSTTIVSTCFIFFFTAFVVLTRQQGPAPFPLHYVLPYATSGSMMDRPILEEHAPCHCPTYPSNSSNEFSNRIPLQRNATPGPSNVPRTPSPTPSSAIPETNNWDLWAHYENFPPPTYDPTSLRPPEWALDDNTPLPLDPQSPHHILSPNLLSPQRDSDPFNPFSLDYEWPALSNRDQEILGPYHSQAWEVRRANVEARFCLRGRISMDEYLAVHHGDPIKRVGSTAVTPAVCLSM